MIERAEYLAIITVIFILIGVPIAILGYQYGLRPALAPVRTIDIVAAAPEAGGFQPDAIEVQKGETVRLRFSVPDVTHGIAIAGLGIDLDHIDPGQVKEVEVRFDEAGRITFYCNTWCSPNHWRMRGTITVIDPADPKAHRQVDHAPDPVIESLIERGIDIDAPHLATVSPKVLPSTAEGAILIRQHQTDLPADLLNPVWLQQHSPAEAYLRLASSSLSLTESQRWNIVAYLWSRALSTDEWTWAQSQYTKNCAACHGETGRGDGPAAAAINAQLENSMMHDQQVASFTSTPSAMGATSELYYAKIRRGGMGTSMPGFGTIFDTAESWRLVHYLWWLTFNPDESPDQPPGWAE